MNRKANERTPSTRSLAVLCAMSAVGLGLLAIYSFRNSAANVFALSALVLALGGMAGTLFFLTLTRAMIYARSTVENEDVLAEGIGRIHGKLAGLAVIATNCRIIAVSARINSKPVVSASIPYEEIKKFTASVDSLFVKAQDEEISLVRCAPSQVAAIAAEIRVHSSMA